LVDEDVHELTLEHGLQEGFSLFLGGGWGLRKLVGVLIVGEGGFGCGWFWFRGGGF
jgi:hypothetical protein